MPIPTHVRQRIDNPMSSEESDVDFDETVIGSMAQVLREDPEVGPSQASSGADLFYVRTVLAPIVKRCTPGDDRSARDITPWHLMPKVLNALARMELTRIKVVEEATRALEMNNSLRKKKAAGEGDEILLLSNDKKKELRSLIQPKLCTTLRQNYMFITLQARVIHIYEDLRIRAAGIDELITSYFPPDVATPTSHLFIHSMKTAPPEELKSYTATRMLMCDMYRDVDVWEDKLAGVISENIMNGLADDPKHKFSYSEDFEKEFQPSISWIQVVNMATGWGKTVQNMVNALEKVFEP